MLSSNRQYEKQALLHLVHSGMSLRQLSRKERVVLGAICLCTLALLAALQHGRVFLGDEIGTLRYLKESPSYILTHFGTWLSMNYFILVEKGVAWLCGAAKLATNSAADSSCRGNNSVNCFACTQIYRLDADRADCCELSRVQPLPGVLGPSDSGLLTPSGIESLGDQ